MNRIFTILLAQKPQRYSGNEVFPLLERVLYYYYHHPHHCRNFNPLQRIK